MKLNIKAVKQETETQTRKPLPEGWHHAVVILDEVKRNSKDTGDVLILTFEIIGDSPHAGSWVWANYNVVHINPQAVQIAEDQLGKLADAAGLETIGYPHELHQRPVQILIKQREWNGEIKNDVKGYKKAEMKNAGPSPVKASMSDVPF